MKIIEWLEFKIPLTMLQLGIVLYIFTHHGFVPRFIRNKLEQDLLRLGTYLCFARIREFPAKPYTNSYTIHTLLPHRHVYRYIISLQSFLRFVKSYPQIIVYDDGTLTQKDRILLGRVPRMSILPAWWTQQQFYIYYHKNTILSKYRDIAITTRKTIDITFLKGNAPKSMILDCDVGFFEEPHDILNYLEDTVYSPNILYIRDVQDAYITNKTALEHIYNRRITSRVNTGLICFRSSILTKKFIENVFTALERNKTNYSYYYVWAEQVPWALLTAIHSSRPLSSAYYIGIGKTPPDTICRHYVYDTKYYFIVDLLRLL